MRDIELTEEELVWLGDNGVTHYLPDWNKWTKCLERTELVKEIKLLNKLTSSRMRKELRIRHDDWMRKIQEAADKGKIGRMLKKIIGGSQDFTLEVLYNKDGNTTDCDEIASEVNRMFGQEWFFQTDEEREKGVKIRGMMKSGCGADFDKLSGEMGIPNHVSPLIRVGLLRKPASEECMKESIGLAHYVPTLEEFKIHIKHLNPRSAGGPFTSSWYKCGLRR
jgi:hypothetical protein